MDSYGNDDMMLAMSTYLRNLEKSPLMFVTMPEKKLRAIGIQALRRKRRPSRKGGKFRPDRKLFYACCTIFFASESVLALGLEKRESHINI
jgi:hypothetical protein